MKRISIRLILFWFAFVFSLQAAQEKRPLADVLPPFESLLKQAMAHSLKLQKNRLSAEHAVSEKIQNGYDLRPQFALSSSLDAEPSWEGKKGSVQQVFKAQAFYDVYDFGRDSLKTQQLQSRIDMFAFGEEDIREEILWQTVRNYFSAYASLNLLRISEKNAEISQRKWQSIQLSFQNGLRSQADLVAAEADLGTARINLEKTRSTFESDLSLLLKSADIQDPLILGRNEKIFFQVQDPTSWESLLLKKHAFQQSAFQKKNEKTLQELSLKRQQVYAETLPQISTVWTTQKSGSFGKEMKKNFDLSLRVTWDIPWKGQTREAEKQISLETQMLETDIQDELKRRRQQEADALEKFQNLKTIWTLTDKQTSLRQRQRDLTQVRYESGKASFLELSNVELELGNLRLERARLLNSFLGLALDMAEARRWSDPEALFL